MALSASPRAAGLQKVISDITESVRVMKTSFGDTSLPITDDDASFHRFCAKLEQALESGRRSRGLFGSQKCFWNYFCQCLIAGKNSHDGLKFAKLNDELKTSYGRGRAFIRYCLMHHCLADTLQQCFINEKVTKEWYGSNSIPSSEELWLLLIPALYELNEIQFDLSPHVHDLDEGWPTFARKIFPSAYSWKPPSRSVSISSLNSTMSHNMDTMSSSIVENDDEEKIHLRERIEMFNNDITNLKANEDKFLAQIKELQQDSQEKVRLERKLKEMEILNKKLTKENEQRHAEWNEKEARLMKNIVEAEKQASEYIARHECAVQQLQTSCTGEEKLSEVVTQLQESNHEREIKIKLLEKELKIVNDAEYEVQIAKLNDKMADLVRKNDDAVRRVEELLEQKEKLAHEILTQEKSHQQTLAEVTSANKKLESERDEEITKLRNVNGELRSMVEDLETNKLDLITQLQSLEKETTSLQDEVSQKDQELVDLREKITLATTNVPDEPLVDHEDRLRTFSDELQALKHQKMKAELEKSELSQKYELSTREYEESLGEIAEKEKIMFRQEVEISELKKSMESVDIILRKQELMIDNLEKKLKVSLEDNLKLNHERECRQDAPRTTESAELDAPIEIHVDLAQNELDDDDEVVSTKSNDQVVDGDSEQVNEQVDEPSVSGESPLLTKASRTLTRLESLVQEGEEIQSIVESTKEVRSTMISKVQQQEEKLKQQREVIEQNESRFENLKTEHVKLLTSESILRYELKEKRKMLEQLKKQLSSSRNTWTAARRVQNAAEAEWQSLHAEFASRPKQASEESGFISDDVKVPEVNADSATASQASSAPELAGIAAGADFRASDGPDLSSTDESSPAHDTNNAERGQNRLQYLEDQCQFLYMKLVQSSKKSEYLESKLNQLLGLNSDGSSDTENNIESIAEIDDMTGENAAEIVPENCHLELLSDENKDEIEVSRDDRDVVDCGVPSSSNEMQRQSSPVDDPNADLCTFATYVKAMSNCSDDENDSIMSEDEDYVTTESRLSTHDESLNIPYADDEKSPERESTVVESRESEAEVLLEESRVKTEENRECLEKLSQVKGVAEIRSGLKEMVSKAKAASNLNSQLQTVMSEKENLQNLLEKSVGEQKSWTQKEAELRKRADMMIRKERNGFEDKLKQLANEKRDLQGSIDQLRNEKDKADIMNAELNQALANLQTSKDELEQELNSVKFQLSTESLKHKRTLKVYSEHEADIIKMRERISEQEHLIVYLEESLKDIKDGREIERAKQLAELEQLQLDLSTRSEECSTLTEELRLTTRKLDEELNLSSELKIVLEETKLQNLIFVSKLESELAQLRKDNRDLMEKLIKLIRDKDMLWQKTDRLTDMQKISTPGRWMDDNETTHCLDCKAEFSLFLRKHHCRLCGMIFCKDCSDNWLKIAASSGKSRVCNTCFINREAFTTEVYDQSALGNSGDELTPSNKDQTEEDSEFRVDVNVRSRSLSASATNNQTSSTCILDEKDVICESVIAPEDMSLDVANDRMNFRSSSAPPCLGGKKMNSEPSDDDSDTSSNDGFHVISDEEISKSLSGTSPYSSRYEYNLSNSFHCPTTKTVFDIEGNGQYGSFTEVWINAGGCYSVPIFIEENNLKLLWEFMTEPRSIAFAVQYKEVDVEPKDVVTQPLLPTTRCKSHVHPIHGSLRVRRKGIYTLIFDNRFSMIMAKKLKYKLRIQR